MSDKKRTALTVTSESYAYLVDNSMGICVNCKHSQEGCECLHAATNARDAAMRPVNPTSMSMAQRSLC